MKDWLIGWLGAVIITAAILIIGALEDKPVQDQIAADEIKAAEVQEKVDQALIDRQLKAQQAYMDHLLGLGKK